MTRNASKRASKLKPLAFYSVALVQGVAEYRVSLLGAAGAAVTPRMKRKCGSEVPHERKARRAARAAAHLPGEAGRLDSKRPPRTSDSGADEHDRRREDGKSNRVLDARSEAIPRRDGNGSLKFADHPEFRPNLTPAQVLQLGSFGGTYFRPIYSGITGQHYDGTTQAREFPQEWYDGLDLRTRVTSSVYRTSVNRYRVKSGASLEEWESKRWIVEQDPYGWFQWYCRFYLGRRSDDDTRQIGRANQVMGPTGRFRIQLMNKVIRAGARFDDDSISPVIRQTLQHWGYALTEKDLERHVTRVSK
mmetsp:Transcript_5964/g.12600  ORF Transcript_5964/g.12600 Transcript_5964/m.12600 type:complete len:304 (-) Transcript_5964:1116-2027(-)